MSCDFDLMFHNWIWCKCNFGQPVLVGGVDVSCCKVQ